MTDSTHKPLAPRDLVILSVLADGPSHGYGMIKAVAARSKSGLQLDPANLYRVLRRMRTLGWIEPTGEPDGQRRVYAITKQGSAVLSAEILRLEELLALTRPGVA